MIDKEWSKLMSVRYKLKQIDTLLYEISRDYRVSGFHCDNQAAREECKSAFKLLDGINKKVHVIFDEACKSEVTGK
jgi:hypothetical protein